MLARSLLAVLVFLATPSLAETRLKTVATFSILGDLAMQAGGDKVECSGVNSCKGQASCATAEHSCAGKNACKGQGWVELSAADCAKKGGKVVTPTPKKM